MITEIEDIREHFERFRAVTLQVLDIISDEELSWRPDNYSFSCGQHLLHIAQAENFYAYGLFEHNWDLERLRLRKVVDSRAELREFFSAVRQRTLASLNSLDPNDLGKIWEVPNAPMPLSLRSWMWFMVEHEIHHKAQLAVYLRQMGHVAPFYALPLPLGVRPDIKAREDLGGF